ncbi:FadR/GntR family transcriptional regulator [Thalassorhabdomicrobium marinisediminis]|uniref:FadR/GntR family transcriptional regulator n=1 Tax=Thalassorhabdomicrobium marinisediminis TaxID=2170577 RepID=UPI0024919AE5|nr:FadR/GntR family transcriptional regulator [Thalassorhabdomicrobium marinisediminis]
MLRQIRLSDQVMQHLQAYIAEQRLTSGDQLPSETELARKLGVGRPTVREAVNLLAGAGLVRVSSGKRPLVGEITGDAISLIVKHAMAVKQISPLEVLEFRRYLEAGVIGLACQRRSDEDVNALFAIVDGMERQVGKLEEFSRCDVAFHTLLSKATGNPVSLVIGGGISEVVLSSSRNGLCAVRTQAEWDLVPRLHRDIAIAVRDKKIGAARAALSAHFDVAADRLQRLADEP